MARRWVAGASGCFARVLAAALLAVAPTACDGAAGRGASSPDDHGHELVGAAAPAFELPLFNGSGRASLAQAKGKVVIVDFWATWCAPCKDSFPYYQSLVDRHPGKVEVLAVSVDEEPDAIEDFVAETGARFPVVWDEGQGTARQYSPATMPTSYIVDRDGVVRFVHSGFKSGDEARIDALVTDLL